MGIEKRTKQISGHTYELETFGARQGMSVFLTLVRFLGPSLVEALSTAEDNSGLAKALATFATTSKEADFNLVVEAFAGRTVLIMPTQSNVPGSAVRVPLLQVYDTHFSGLYGDLLQWLIWAAGENFGRFFGGQAKDLAATFMATMTPSPEAASVSPSPLG